MRSPTRSAARRGRCCAGSPSSTCSRCPTAGAASPSGSPARPTTALQRGGVRDPMKALVLAALEMADDLHRAREEKTRDAGEVEARLGALVELLDRVASDPPRRT